MPPSRSRRRAPVKRRPEEEAAGKRGRGRPRIVPGMEMLMKAKAAALAGYTMERTAKYLGIDRTTLRKHPEILAAMEEEVMALGVMAGQTAVEIMQNRKAPGPAGSMARYILTKRVGGPWADKMTLTGSAEEPIEVKAKGFDLAADKLAEALKIYARAQKDD